MNLLPIILLALVALLILGGGATVLMKQAANRYALEAVRRLLAQYQEEVRGEVGGALQDFKDQARTYRLHDAQRADALAGMLFRVTGVEATLATLLGGREEPSETDFPNAATLDAYMRVREIPSSKRSEITFLHGMDAKRAVREVIQYRRVQDVTALRGALGAMQRAFDKARPYLPPSILQDYANVTDRGRSLALNEDALDEMAWQACRHAAQTVGDILRRLPEALRREMARPMDAGVTDATDAGTA